MSTDLTTAVTGFSIAVPDGWFEFDLTDRNAERELRQTLMSRVGTDPTLRTGVRMLTDSLGQTLRIARQRGALYAAGTYTPCQDGLFHANVMVSGVATAPGQDPDVLGMLRRWTRPGGGGGGEAGKPWRRLNTAELAEVGRAVRVTGLEHLVVGELTVPYLVSHTVIAVPGTAGTRHFVVTCGSPNVDLGDDLFELFDLVAGTFRFVAPEPVAA